VELDYLQLFIKNSSGGQGILSVLSLCFLIVGRIGPIIGLSPFFGARILPAPVKFGLALTFVAMLLPKLLITVTTPLSFNFELFCLMMREVLIGTIFGFFLGLPFLIVSSAGVFIDHQRGAASLMTNDPTIQNQSSPIGTLYNMMLIVLFWAVNGPFYVLDSLFLSYDLLPPDKWSFPSFLLENSLLHERLIHVLYIFATLSLQLCMPAFLALLMTDTFLGIINRLAPQVQITFLGMGLKSWFAILVVCIGFSPFVSQLTKQIENWLIEFHEIIQEICTQEGELPGRETGPPLQKQAAKMINEKFQVQF
jgi:type III secretory pathway component EscT